MILHASAVAFGGRAVLITGAAGSGKSSLALQLMALGAALISDDRTVLTRDGSSVIASAGPNIAGLIEARGIGILNAATSAPAPVTCVVDLDQTETERLPQRRIMLLDVPLPLLHKSDNPAWPAALRAYMTAGMADR
ncbi:MAG: HPr kinase/phosphatase C-terminal domain-containing protein [Pseudomonadota bacterium]